jgi:hypothetical protein
MSIIEEAGKNKSSIGWSFVRNPEWILKFNFVEKFYKYEDVFNSHHKSVNDYDYDYDHHNK